MNAEHEIGYATFPRRMYALIVDFLVVIGIFMAAVVLVTFAIPDVLASVIMGLAIGVILLYDPLMVSARGGTVGHYRLNLRVVRQDTGKRVGFLRALVRSWLKAFTGLFSFFFMPITRRHQAFHDLLTHSTVVIHNMELAEAGHYGVARDEHLSISVSKRRRVIVIGAYWIGVFVVMSVVPLPFVSPECYAPGNCTAGEDALLNVAGLVMIIGFGITMVLGWKGLLPGARNRPSNSGEMNGA